MSRARSSLVLLLLLAALGGGRSVLLADPPEGESGPAHKMLPRAEKGDPEAQFQVGADAESRAARLKWLRLAARQGHAGATYLLVRALLSGLPGDEQPDVPSLTAEEQAEGAVLLKQAAERGNPLAQALLSEVLDFGWGWEVPGIARGQDPAGALAWLQRSARGGLAQSQRRLGDYYATGRWEKMPDVEPDFAKAAEWYREAAQQAVDVEGRFGEHWYVSFFTHRRESVQAARVALAVLHLLGRGVRRDEKQAVDLLAEVYRECGWWPTEKPEQAAITYLGRRLAEGIGIARDDVEALKYFLWAKRGWAPAPSATQFNHAWMLLWGRGTPRDVAGAWKLLRKAANAGVGRAPGVHSTPPAGEARAQWALACLYRHGVGVERDDMQAAGLAQAAAEGGEPRAYLMLGQMLRGGRGVLRDDIDAYAWLARAQSAGVGGAERELRQLEAELGRSEVAAGQARAKAMALQAATGVGWDPVGMLEQMALLDVSWPSDDPAVGSVGRTGTGFYVSEVGHIVTSAHVVVGATAIEVTDAEGRVEAKLLAIDPANDLAVLGTGRRSRALPLAHSRGVRLGAQVVTLGFPNPDLQGLSPKLSRGEVAGLLGPRDDPRYFQVSLPVQPGNSGGPLLDANGSAIGVVAARLSAEAAVESSGATPENVNYAVKSVYLLALLDGVTDFKPTSLPAQPSASTVEDLVLRAQPSVVLITAK